MRYTAALLLVCFPCAVLGGQKDIVLYLDGAVVTEVLPVVKGEAEIVLPPGADPSTLRLRPAGCAITRVGTASSPAAKGKKEIPELEERKAALRDRLRALEVREEIFQNAAKSQSAKAPRKTKANPDPLETVRKGTDFAIAQLESVYRLRRRTEAEAAAVEERLRQLRASAAPVVTRVKVAGKGSLTASYVRSDLSWKPFYDLRVDGAEVAIAQHALVPKVDGARVAVVPGKLEIAGTGAAVPVAGDFPLVANMRIPLKSASSPTSPQASFSFVFPLPEEGLPPGDAACFRAGEFMGNAAVVGSGADGLVQVRCGG